MTKQRIATAVCSVFLAAGLAVSSTAATGNLFNQAPDNTNANKADRNQATPTADQSKNNLSDRQIASHIRRDVVKDKKLSTYAHNVKIVSDHGKVTLRGPVRSDDEKQAIEEHARKYAGDGNVTNELTVASEKH